MQHPAFDLDSKYTEVSGRAFLTGIQALVRLPLEQRRRDQAAGLNTGGFISGYRGSPLGGYDTELKRAQLHLDAAGVVFQPGVNEDLAATAIWGTQQVGLYPGNRVDGVFGLWYGKSPGVDRSGDAFRHANGAGTSRRGGALAIAGDDPLCKSSTYPGQSEYALITAEMPVLSPASVQEVLDYGLTGIALSRFSGLWVGLVCPTDLMDSAAVIDVDERRLAFMEPAFEMPPGGLHIRRGDSGLEAERRLRDFKLPAARAFAVANHLNRLLLDPPGARVGIVACGKAYADLRETMDSLGITEARLQASGVRLLKVGMPWPLEPSWVKDFARGLERILVFESKRPLVEEQLTAALYHTPDRPEVLGKRDRDGRPLLPDTGTLEATDIGRVLLAYLPEGAMPADHPGIASDEVRALLKGLPEAGARPPHFCSGCPHSRSTRLPEGSRGLAGIGCHYMVQWMDRDTDGFTHMGSEGLTWTGQAPFTDEPHVFVNLGDGTYYHSGILAIRAAVAAKARMTYKLLFNDAVAMTGGQAVDGPLTVPMLTRQLEAEGVARIVVVTSDMARYADRTGIAPGVTIRPREELDAVQRELAAMPGVTILIYDQTCAAELRRRRKRGTVPAAPRRVFINQEVCEGCGDCSVQSNCLSVEPVETALGTKRRINQASCNSDYSCLQGFCPSFVTVEGAVPPKAGVAPMPDVSALPEPAFAVPDRPWNIVVGGVGGTGITTLSAILGTAAFADGLQATTLDMSGLAQKGGPVQAHVRIVGPEHEPLASPTVPRAEADLVLAADLVVSAGTELMLRASPGRTRAVLDTALMPTAGFVRNRDLKLDGTLMERRLAAVTSVVARVDALALAAKHLGDPQYANILLAGVAWQLGLIPIRLAAIERAIALNGVAVKANQAAFALGRWAALQPAETAALAPAPAETLESLLADRVRRLTAYQDQALAERYAAQVRRAEQAGGEALARVVARAYYKLLAIKDEYEVARLHADPAFKAGLQAALGSAGKVKVHLAPPLLSRPDPVTGRPPKHAFGPWIFPLFRLLAGMRGLRGRWVDPFAHTEERKAERALIAEYEATLDTVLAKLAPHNREAALALLALPDSIRGFGPVKLAAMQRAAAERTALLARLDAAPDLADAA